MASITNRFSQFGGSSAECAPVCCPDCCGLECLCRPRFFAGQLLTDDDLKRLDHYITEKNKLHNRYLVGWGVACGLEVVCNACDGLVTVKPGYALSPCGEDIVVCHEVAVDVCSMIQKCQKKQPRDCQPFQPEPDDPCKDTTEPWILSIHYDEKTSRGIVPLKNAGAACCSRCACGGSSACGCKCHSSGNGCSCGGHEAGHGNGGSNGNGCSCGKSHGTRQKTSAQPQCEPTIVCEGYRFEVCKLQKTLTETPPTGAITQRFQDCYTPLLGLIPPLQQPADPQQVQNWCCSVRDNLLEFFAEHPGYDCSIPQKLAVLCNAGSDLKGEVAFAWAQHFKDCLCRSFLPPCPCPVEDARVPLATITVSKKDGVCRIVSICNLDVRKFLTTFPNLSYWLSWSPVVRNLRKLLSAVCCRPMDKRKVTFGEQSATFRPVSRAAATVGAANTVNPMNKVDDNTEISEVLFQAFKNTQPVDAQTLSMAALGLTDVNNNPFLTEVEMKHPLETLIFNQLLRPLVEATLPAEFAGLWGVTARAAEAKPAAAPETTRAAETQPDLKAQLDDLKSKMQEMQQELQQSQEQLDKLSKKKK